MKICDRCNGEDTEENPIYSNYIKPNIDLCQECTVQYHVLINLFLDGTITDDEITNKTETS